MKTVVLSHTPLATVFNPTFLSYARARQFGAIACNVCRGNEKGLVERPIGFVRERFWPGCRPSDLLDINVKAAAWRDTFANNRVHDITGKVPALVFEHDERQSLAAYPGSLVQYRRRRHRHSQQDLSRPFRPQSLLCAAASGGPMRPRARHRHDVSVFLGPKRVASHARCWDTNKDNELPPTARPPWPKSLAASPTNCRPAWSASALSASVTSKSWLLARARFAEKACA